MRKPTGKLAYAYATIVEMRTRRELLERENVELKLYVEKLRLAALNAISFMCGGVEKAELRDAYDATPEQCLADHNRRLLRNAATYLESHTSTSKTTHQILMEYADGLSKNCS
jgi:hypothetical protein